MILSVGHLLSSIYLVQLKSLSRRSTIFPYTTLFRSDDRENAGAGLRLSTGRDGEDELHAQPRAHHEEAATASAERATTSTTAGESSICSARAHSSPSMKPRIPGKARWCVASRSLATPPDAEKTVRSIGGPGYRVSRTPPQSA